MGRGVAARSIAQYLQSFAILHRTVHERRNALIEPRNERSLAQAEEHALAVAVVRHRVCSSAWIDHGGTPQSRPGELDQLRALGVAQNSLEQHDDRTLEAL